MNYRSELFRKLIHFGSAIFPLVYYAYLTRAEMLWILGGLSIIFLIGELLRIKIVPIKRFIEMIFGSIIRASEKDKLTGATFVFVSGFLTVLIFEKDVAVFSMLTLSLADAMAALVGRKWGRKKLFTKTVEGTMTFLIVALVLAILWPGLPRVGAVTAAGIATIAELLSSPIDDNIMIPLAVATTLSFFQLIP